MNDKNTDWHPSEKFGYPYVERWDSILDTTIIRLQFTVQQAVQPEDIDNPSIVTYLKSRMSDEFLRKAREISIARGEF